jgi:hypothetical protein
LTARVATLSIMLKTGLNPRFERYSMFVLKLFTIVSAFASLMGVAKMAFVVQSYMMNNARVPSIAVMGKLPVRSAYIVPFLGSIAPIAINIWLVGSVVLGGLTSRSYSIIESAFSILIFVDRIPLACRFMWPLSVAGHESGRYLLTASAVSPGHVDNWLFLIAFIRVRLGGQNRH